MHIGPSYPDTPTLFIIKTHFYTCSQALQTPLQITNFITQIIHFITHSLDMINSALYKSRGIQKSYALP
jgi:hypothetical protein